MNVNNARVAVTLMLLIGAGGCTGFDVVTILKKSRQAVSDCYVELEAERAETDPKVFTKIHMHFVVSGRGLPASAVERAVALSHERSHPIGRIEQSGSRFHFKAK